MNLKKLGLPVLCCGAAFLTSCGYEFIQHKDLNYEDAKAWIVKTYGEGTKEGTIKVPKSVTSEWFVDCKVYDVAAGTEQDGTKYLVDHIANFLINYTYNESETVYKTRLEDRLVENCALGYKTTSVLTSEAPKDFYYSLDGQHIDTTLDWFFMGSKKYGAVYRAYSNKTLEIYGNFYFSRYNETNLGYDMLEIPYCTTTFNSDGSIKQIKFDFKAEAKCNYFWVSTQKAGYSGATYFNMLKGSYININFNY